MMICGQRSTAHFTEWRSSFAVPRSVEAIVVSAPPKVMRSMMQIVDKLDIRRAQVLVEAIIVEVIVDQKNELGVSVAHSVNGGS